MVANGKKETLGSDYWWYTTIDDLRPAVKANITATFDITPNDKDRVGADAAGNQESITFSRHYAGI